MEDKGKYRDQLCKGRDDAQDGYDKAILSAAAGGLVVALGFVKTGASPIWPWLLLVAAASFAFSLLSVIHSFKTSGRSFDAAIAQVDSQVEDGLIYHETPGGPHTKTTERWNLMAFVALLTGIASLAVFVTLNLGRN